MPPLWTINAERLLGVLPPGRRSCGDLEIPNDPSTRVLVLDDDPTGTQTVHSVPVVTTPDAGALKTALVSNPLVYLLTNSRAMEPASAEELALMIGQTVRDIADETGLVVRVISRSDSTLRGHFPAEVTMLAEGLGQPMDACILVPALPASGRITWSNVHWILQGEEYVPVSATEYAEDPRFGYSTAWMPGWIEERSQGGVPAGAVKTIDLEDIRIGGPSHVAAKLRSFANSTYVVVNCVTEEDVDIVAAACRLAEAAGSRFVYRTAASFVRAYGGVPPRGLLSPVELNVRGDNGGLVVCGSFVPLSTRQVAAALELPTVRGIEVSVISLVASAESAAMEISRVYEEALAVIRRGDCALVYTSRDFLPTGGASETASAALVSITRKLKDDAAFVVSKGGITSADVAVHALGWKIAWVEGQIASNVPVWTETGVDEPSGLSLVVFPGNIGDDHTLANIITELSARGS